VDGERRANKLHPTCRGNGDGMYAEETRGNTGSPNGDRGRDQLATRERQAGPSGVTERSVVPERSGNSGGGKGPQLKTNARSDKGPRGLAMSLTTPFSVQKSYKRGCQVKNTSPCRNARNIFRHPAPCHIADVFSLAA
jgi:hypothetical protein